MAEVYPECCADAAPPPRPAARALHRAQGAHAEAGSARSAARERRARGRGCGLWASSRQTAMRLALPRRSGARAASAGKAPRQCRLLLLRHAESEPVESGGRDIDRPLTPNGACVRA